MNKLVIIFLMLIQVLPAKADPVQDVLNNEAQARATASAQIQQARALILQNLQMSGINPAYVPGLNFSALDAAQIRVNAYGSQIPQQYQITPVAAPVPIYTAPPVNTFTIMPASTIIPTDTILHNMWSSNVFNRSLNQNQAKQAGFEIR